MERLIPSSKTVHTRRWLFKSATHPGSFQDGVSPGKAPDEIAPTLKKALAMVGPVVVAFRSITGITTV